MKKIIITAVLSIISATSIGAQDALKPTEGKTGWLWEIRGNGIAQTCYLFGTCHGGGHSFSHEDVLGFSGVDEALKNVKTVYFETDLTVSMRLAAKEMSIAQYLGCDRDTTYILETEDGSIMANLYVTMAAATDKNGAIIGEKGKIVITNINNYRRIELLTTDDELIEACDAEGEFYEGLVCEMRACMKAIQKGRIQCTEMPWQRTAQIARINDTVRAMM